MDNSFAEDDHNFTLKFKQAWAPYSNTMSTGRGSIISKAAFEEMGETDFARAPIGSGPYKIVEWNPGTQIKLTRNEYYHGEPAKTENIIIKFISEPTARVIELETASADIVYYIEGNDISRVEGIDGYHIEKGDSYRYFTLCLSMQEPLFQDQRVREALCYAINKEDLVKATTNGVGTPINGYCPTVMDGYIDMGETKQDVEKAKQLLADAGYRTDSPSICTCSLKRFISVPQRSSKATGKRSALLQTSFPTHWRPTMHSTRASSRRPCVTVRQQRFLTYSSSMNPASVPD